MPNKCFEVFAAWIDTYWKSTSARIASWPAQ